MAKITLYRRHAHHTVRVPKNGLRKLLFRPPKPKVLLICLVCLIEAPFEWLKTVLALENCKKEIFGPQWDLSCVPMLYRLFSIVDCPIQIHSVKPVLLESDMETDIVVAPLRNFFAVFFFGILRFNNPLWFFSGFIFYRWRRLAHLLPGIRSRCWATKPSSLRRNRPPFSRIGVRNINLRRRKESEKT